MAAPWEGVVRIPEGVRGEYKIQHFTRPAGPVARSNFRCAILSGNGDVPSLRFDRETRWHKLVGPTGTWMTDLPIEQHQIDAMLSEPCFHEGTVLVGGLGIGYAANVLAAREGVTRIVVVEIAPEVVELVGPHLIDPQNKVVIVQADLFDFCRQNTETFGGAFIDIWQADSEGTFHHVVLPLRRAARRFVDDHHIHCWNEDVMRGQLSSGLMTRSLFLRHPAVASGTGLAMPTLDRLCEEIPPGQPGAAYWNWSRPFWRAVRAGTADYGMAPAYASRYGKTGWEAWWESETGIKATERKIPADA